MAKKNRIKNVIAKDLFTPKYKPKTEAKEKGKGSYDRRKDKKTMKEQLKSCSFFLCATKKCVLSLAL